MFDHEESLIVDEIHDCLCVVWSDVCLGPVPSATSWDVEEIQKILIQEIQRQEGTLFLQKGDILLLDGTWTLTLELSFRPDYHR